MLKNNNTDESHDVTVVGEAPAYRSALRGNTSHGEAGGLMVSLPLNISTLHE